MTMHRRFIHGLVVALMLLGLGASSFRPAAAQIDGDAYTDPDYDWQITWDGDVWTVEEKPTYELVLRNEGDSYLFFQNRDDWGDAQACLDGRVDEVASEDGVDAVEPLEDEDGDPIGASSNDRASAAYSLTYTDPDRANARPIERVNAFDCRVLVAGEAVLAMTFVTSVGAYENDVEDVDDLLGGLDIPETSGADETPTGTPADEATGTPDDEATSTRAAAERTTTSTAAPTATPDEEEPTGTPEREPTATAEATATERTTARSRPTATQEDQAEARAGTETETVTPDETEALGQAPDPTAGIDGNTYTSPTYGYSLEWDEDVWVPDYERARLPNRDILVLDLVETGGYAYFEAYDAYEGDPGECFIGSSDEALISDAIDDVEPYVDENGDGVVGNEDGVVYGAFTLTLTLDDGTEEEDAAYFECRTLVEGEAVLAVSLVAYEPDFEDARAALDNLLSTLDLSDVQSGTDAGNGTETPESDEETATSTSDDEETATPEGDDQAGVNVDSYTSPTYGYALEWDEDVWEVDEEFTGSGDRDTLKLDFGSAGYVLFEGYEAYDGDADDCLEGAANETLEDPATDNVEPYEDENGVALEGEFNGAPYAAYTFEFDGVAAAGLFQCQTLVEDEAVLAISLIVAEDDFNDALDALAEVVDTIELQGDSGSNGGDDGTATPERDEETATPEDDATATPEDDETATPDADTGDAGVNGNSYESATYGYTVEWDEDVWQVNEDLTESGDRDALVLEYVDDGRLYVEGYEAYGGDPEDCLDGSADEVLTLDSVDNVEPYEERNGDRVEGEEDGVVFAAYSLDIEDTAVVGYFTCQTLVEDESVLAFSLILTEDVAEDGIDAFMDVQASLDLGGRSNADSTPTPAPDEETPTPDSGGDGAGVNGNAYESPTYGFTLEWDEDVWEVDEASSEDGVDRLVLTDVGSTVTFEATEGFDGDAEACVAAAEDEIVGRRGVDDVEILEDDDGPIVEGDEESAYAYYGYTLEQRNGDTEQRYEYVECSALGDGASVLRVSQAALAADADEELEALGILLDGLDLTTGGPVLWRSARTIAA